MAPGVDIRQSGTNVNPCLALKVGKPVVKEPSADPGNLARRVPPGTATAQTETDNGIEVHEEEWGRVTVQRLYKVRCDCGRSWFELELPKVVKCPNCRKLSLVSI